MSYDTATRINSIHSIEEDIKVQRHEEADTLIPLHVQGIHVHSTDTDVIVLLIDLLSNNYLGILTVLHGHRYEIP